MANRKLIVEIVGDDKSVQRAFDRSTRSANKFGVAMTKVQRRVSGGFLGGRAGGGTAALAGGAALALALRNVISAATEAETVLGQVSVAVEDAGLSWQQSAKRIEAGAEAISNASALDDEAVLRSFQVFVRSQRDVEKSLELAALAADVARGRYIDLEAATTLVNKASLGQIGALRRIGIQIDANATSTEALAVLQRTFAGSAEKFGSSSAGSMERFNVQLENSKELIGGPLLSAVGLLADRMADVLSVTNKVAEGLHTIGSIKIPAIHIPFVADLPGGKVGGVVSRIFKEVALTPAVLRPFQLANKLLRGGDDDPTAASARGQGPPGRDQEKATQAQQKRAKAGQTLVDAINKVIGVTRKQVDATVKQGEAQIAAEQAADRARVAAEKSREAFQGLVEALGLRLDKARVTAGLQDDLRELGKIEAAIKARIKAEGRTLDLERQLFDVQQDIIEARKQRAANQKAAARAATQAAQFRTLGLSATGEDLTPTVSALKARFAKLGDAVEGSALDTSKLKSLFARIRKLFAGEFGKITEESRKILDGIFDGLEDKLGSASGPLTKTSGLNTKKIVEGLGLDADTAAQIRSRLSGFNSAGRTLAGATATTGGGRPIIVESTTNLIVDGATLAKLVTRNQQKTRRRNPQQKRGPNRIGA